MLGVAPLGHSQVRFPMMIPNASLRPEVRSSNFHAIPWQTISGFGMHNRVFGKSALQAPHASALNFLRLLGASFQRNVAAHGLLVHVMLHPTEDELRIGEIPIAEIMAILLELFQRDASRGHAHQSLFDVRHPAIFV